MTGQLIITNQFIRVELVSFDEFFFIDDSAHLSLRLEDNRFASLHSPHFGGPGGSYNASHTTHHQTITASTLVLGPDKWLPNDPIMQVAFEIPLASNLLRFEEKIEELETGKAWDHAQSEVCLLQLPDYEVKIYYSLTISIMADKVRVVSPVIAFEFFTPRMIDNYLEDVQIAVTFISAVLSEYLRPDEIRICKLSTTAMLDAVDRSDFIGDHLVTEMWFRGEAVDVQRPRHHRSFATMQDRVEKEAFEHCLSLWLIRDPQWKRANALMMESLRLKAELTADRMLNACKWLEEIPSANPKQVLEDSEIAIIVAGALKSAEEMEQKQQLASRIPNALASLKYESHKQRFERLVGVVRNRFGSTTINDHMVKDLVFAIGRYRGRVAHGHFEARDDQEAQQFMKSLFAVEALCFLLTIADLPLSEEGVKRIKLHPIVENYRVFHIFPSPPS